MLVYSITNPKSFTLIKEVKEFILRSKGREKVPMVLIGNKCDLENERMVTTTEGEQLARMWNIPFFETSAKLGINVDNAFIVLINELLQFATVSPDILDFPFPDQTPRCYNRCLLL